MPFFRPCASLTLHYFNHRLKCMRCGSVSSFQIDRSIRSVCIFIICFAVSFIAGGYKPSTMSVFIFICTISSLESSIWFNVVNSRLCCTKINGSFVFFCSLLPIQQSTHSFGCSSRRALVQNSKHVLTRCKQDARIRIRY